MLKHCAWYFKQESGLFLHHEAAQDKTGLYRLAVEAAGKQPLKLHFLAPYHPCGPTGETN